MPPKTVSAVQRLTQTMRHYSKRNLLKKSHDALTMMLQERRSWPQREENYAAVQLLLQSRNWNNFRKNGTADTNTGTLQKRGSANRRNNIFKRKYTEDASRKRQNKHQKISHAKEEQEQVQVQEHTKPDNTIDKSEGAVRSLHDVIFDVQDSSDDDLKLQREADNELLKRISKNRTPNPEATLSRKTNAPYNTYKTHRNNWAEFRHRMIYGTSSF